MKTVIILLVSSASLLRVHAASEVIVIPSASNVIAHLMERDGERQFGASHVGQRDHCVATIGPCPGSCRAAGRLTPARAGGEHPLTMMTHPASPMAPVNTP